jgi:hypothetical protein
MSRASLNAANVFPADSAKAMLDAFNEWNVWLDGWMEMEKTRARESGADGRAAISAAEASLFC